MLDGVDVSYAQGDYHPGAEEFVICNASRANIGLAVGSMYHAQVANARAAGKHVGHYFFNGNIDPVTCANYFVDNLAYQAGDSLWLDVESEGSTSTVAWSPANALAFIEQVRSRLGVVPGVYLNRSLMDGFDWSAVAATGAPLWIAYYNPSPPPIQWWPTWTVWQYTSNPIDRNKAQVSLSPAGGGAVPIPDTSSEDDEMKLIHDTESGTVAAVGAGRYFPFGPATASDLNSANAVVKVWGAWTDLTHAEFMENVRATGADMNRLNVPYPYPAAAPVVNVPAPVVNVDEAAIVKGILAALPASVNPAQITAELIAAIRSLAFKAS